MKRYITFFAIKIFISIVTLSFGQDVTVKNNPNNDLTKRNASLEEQININDRPHTVQKE